METEEKKASILFVDDEPAILSGLRNLLRKKRNIWDMQFAEGSVKALEILSQRKFDVMVTDMRMPEMDGAALLAKVRELYPDMVRIILSGHTNAQDIIRSVPVAHRFLSKPCDPELLQNTVERTLALRQRLRAQNIREILGSVDRLPVLPQVYHEISALIADEKTSAEQIARVVEKDPGVSAKLLQLVNSAFFGLPQRITTVERAVTQLGMSTIHGLVVSSAIFDLFSGDESGFSLTDFQQHALAVGRLAKTMASREKDEVFVSGLLHDLGKLVLLKNLPQKFREIMARLKSGAALWKDVEHEIIGCSHAELGASLLELWGIPETVVEAVACHHQPKAAALEKFEAPALVYLANELINGRSVDQADLERWGVQQKFKEWQELAEKLGGKGR